MKILTTTIFLIIAFYSNLYSQQVRRIANGCGPEGRSWQRTASFVGQQVDGVYGGLTKPSSYHTKSCNQHDRDYYFGVPKKIADRNFVKRSPVMGTFVKYSNASNNAYHKAQIKRQRSQYLQPYWEKRNRQCFDRRNYYLR